MPGAAARARLPRQQPALGQPRRLAARDRRGRALVPALSLPDALIAIAIGGAIGQAMLSAAAAIGAQTRVPAMVLMRAPLGRRGSALPTAVNVVQTPGLDRVRAARDRDRRRRALRPAARLPCAVGVDARLRRGRARLRPRRADRRRAARSSAGSRSGRCRSRSPTSSGGRSTTRTCRHCGTDRARAVSRSGRARTSSSASPSRGSRSQPTTRASRATAAAPSGAAPSATCCRTSGCSRSGR